MLRSFCRVIILSLYLLPSVGRADHFSQRNLIDLCKEDTSFDSTCYTYLAAYRDLVGFLVHSTEEERIRLLCLSNPNLTTDRIARRLTVADETRRPGQVAYLLMEEFCN
jgi:hypothetical protein